MALLMVLFTNVVHAQGCEKAIIGSSNPEQSSVYDDVGKELYDLDVKIDEWKAEVTKFETHVEIDAMHPVSDIVTKIAETISVVFLDGGVVQKGVQSLRALILHATSKLAELRSGLYGMLVMMHSVHVELDTVRKWAYATTTIQAENVIRDLYGDLKKPEAKTMPLLVRRAGDLREGLRALRVTHDQFTAVSIPEFTPYQNFIIARKLSELNAQFKLISELYLKCFGSITGDNAAHRHMEELAAMVAQGVHDPHYAQLFESVRASFNYFRPKLSTFLHSAEVLQIASFDRYPVGERIYRLKRRIKLDLSLPTDNLVLLSAGIDGAAVGYYFNKMQMELSNINDKIKALPPIPTRLVPFIGRHSEEVATTMSLVVRNFRIVRIGGNTELLRGSKLYRSSAPHYLVGQNSVMLQQEDIDALRALKIRRILSLNAQGHSVAATRLLKGGGIQMKSLPVADFVPPTLNQVKEAVAFLQAASNAREDTLVYCGFGNGRTGTIIASYEVYKVVEAWEAMHGNIIPFEDLMMYISARSHHSKHDFLRHGVERPPQEHMVRLFAAWLLKEKGASDVPSFLPQMIS